jgi:hypothetical protein
VVAGKKDKTLAGYNENTRIAGFARIFEASVTVEPAQGSVNNLIDW